MAKLTKVRVEGFRLLEDIEIEIEDQITVVVGRNNSGKTSLAEVFDRFLGEQVGKFRLEDFAAVVRPKFCKAKKLFDAERRDLEGALKELPVISLTLRFTYDQHCDDFGALGPFIIDLNTTCTAAKIQIEYAPDLKTISGLLTIPHSEEKLEEKLEERLFGHLREAIPKAYSIRYRAIDPEDATNQRVFDGTTELRALMQTGFIKAQRTLDLSRRGDTNVIGNLLNKLFRTAENSASEDDQALAQDLKTSVADLEQGIQGSFDEHLEKLLPALNTFGFPGLNDTKLRPQTTIDVEGLLTDNTRIFYDGTNGVHLPEGYSGLGTRNLIYILIQLEALHKLYRASTMCRPVTHLVFIEEPEAHLHPQMQEVFIAQLNAAVASLAQQYPDDPIWPVQFVISTHSSHLANAAQFEAIRYFLNVPKKEKGVRCTRVKDFHSGAKKISVADRTFLHKYMTLTKCDLYFADKAILVEGSTERILMPCFFQKVDGKFLKSDKLCHQYITTIEVGGAHAYIFRQLLDFLELKTLIISDLDPVDGERKKCLTADGIGTSNSTLKNWFDNNKITITELLAKTSEDKVKGSCCIAYQIPEGDGDPPQCARSYEDAFILANPQRYENTDERHDGESEKTEKSYDAKDAAEAVKGINKTNEAIKFAVEDKEWNVPLYIREGLIWLSKGGLDDELEGEAVV